jgi:hypothetical protein
MSVTLNIKRIRNEYDLNLNAIVETSAFSVFYEGFKLNTIDNCNKIIEVIPLKYNINKSFFDKIKGCKYIINIVDIIYDFNNIYIIYENYKIYNRIKILNSVEFNKFFNQFRELIIFLVENNFDIEPIQLSDIYIKNDNIYVMIKQIKKNKMIIKTGSPIYSPPEIFNHTNLYLYDKLVWNFGILLHELINGSTPYLLCNDVNQIKLSMKNFNFEDNNILKNFLAYDITNRITYNDFISLDITKFNNFIISDQNDNIDQTDQTDQTDNKIESCRDRDEELFIMED